MNATKIYEDAYFYLNSNYSAGDYINDFELKKRLENLGFEVKIKDVVSTITKTGYRMEVGNAEVYILSVEGTGTMIEYIRHKI